MNKLISTCCQAVETEDMPEEMQRCPECKESASFIDAETYFDDGEPIFVNHRGFISDRRKPSPLSFAKHVLTCLLFAMFGAFFAMLWFIEPSEVIDVAGIFWGLK